MNTEDVASKVYKHIIINKRSVREPHLYVLMGLEYSGKSHLAKIIARHNFAHLWATKIKREYGIDNSQMLKVATLVVRKVENRKINLVVDFTGHIYEIRDRLQQIAKELDLHYQVVFLDTSRNIRMKRREENIEHGEKPGRRIISLDDMELLESQLEPPRPSEPSVILRNQQQIDEFIKSIEVRQGR